MSEPAAQQAGTAQGLPREPAETPALPFTLSGITVPGKRLGTRLGFPTANLAYPPVKALPPNGVYIALAEIDGLRYAAILNQGSHPTAPGGQATIETHLLDYAGGDLYHKPLRLCYLSYLRPEQKFESLQALRDQLKRDQAEARRWVGENAPELTRETCAAPSQTR